MSSLALWYEKSSDSKNTGDQLNATVHFNLWSQCEWKDETPMLDIGFIIENISLAENLCLYLPFAVAASQITDLGERITNHNTLSAVFNESLTVTQSDSSYFPVCKTKENNDFFTLYCLDLENDIALSAKHDGTILAIRVKQIYDQDPKKNIPPGKEYYIRFRIKSDELCKLVRQYKPKNSFLQSSIATTYIVDFRYNYHRSLPSSLTRTFPGTNIGKICTDEIHFLLLTKAHVDVTSGSILTIRELEQRIWNNYVDNTNTKDIIAYKSSVKGSKDHPIEDWEFYAKLIVNKSTIKIAMIYLGVLIIVNLVSSLFYNCVVDKIINAIINLYT